MGRSQSESAHHKIDMKIEKNELVLEDQHRSLGTGLEILSH